MAEEKRLSDERVATLREHVDGALAALERFLAAVREDGGLPQPIRERADAAGRALAGLRREWPEIAGDWQYLRHRFAALAKELHRLERSVGDLAYVLEEEEW